jgi:hypothetical protein
LFLDAGTTTDTDNDNDLVQSTSTTRPSHPVNIIPPDHQSEHKSNQNSSQHLLNTPNQLTNDLNIYSTSVASGASIETLKPSSDNLSSSNKSKPSSWADLFRGNQTTTATPSSSTTTNIPQQSSPIQKVQTTSPQQNGRNNATNNFYPKTNYHVYNSNGDESRSLEGLT